MNSNHVKCVKSAIKRKRMQQLSHDQVRRIRKEILSNLRVISSSSSQSRLENRPKRTIIKPIRYKLTTSLEERPKKRRIETVDVAGIEEEMVDLIKEEEDEDEEDYNKDNIYMPVETPYDLAKLQAETQSSQSLKLHVPEHRSSRRSSQNPTWTDSREQGTSVESAEYEPIKEQNVKTILDKLEKFETDIKSKLNKIDYVLSEILQCVQERHEVVEKPDCLPIKSLSDLVQFETVSNEIYQDVIRYFQSAGGFNLKETVNLCLKEAIEDHILSSVNWFGSQDKLPLCKTMIVRAIYEGVCRNRNFAMPTRSSFENSMRMAVRMAQERARHKRKSGHRTRVDRSYWTSANEEEEESLENKIKIDRERFSV